MDFRTLEVQKFQAQKFEQLGTRIRFSKSCFNLAKNDFYTSNLHHTDEHHMQKLMKNRKLRRYLGIYSAFFHCWVPKTLKRIKNPIRTGHLRLTSDQNFISGNFYWTKTCALKLRNLPRSDAAVKIISMIHKILSIGERKFWLSTKQTGFICSSLCTDKKHFNNNFRSTF